MSSTAPAIRASTVLSRIKVLRESVAQDRDRLRRFETEARAAGALNHPNIVAVFDTGTADGVPYVVSELLDGETLRDRLMAGALRQAKALEFAIQIAEGLGAAHERHVVHRDLKPENLFVTKDGRIKILDFGLAKLRDHEGTPCLAQRSKPGLTPQSREPFSVLWVTCHPNKSVVFPPITDPTSFLSVLSSSKCSPASALSRERHRRRR